MSNKDILNFIFELGQMKKIRHNGFRLAGVDNVNLASVAEHSLRAAQIAFILAKMEKYKNPYEIAAMLIFHDVAECRTGNINKVSGRYLEIDKEKLAQEQLGKLGIIGKEIDQLIGKTNYKSGRAGVIAKDADYLEQAIAAKEHLEKGIKPAETWIKNAGKALQTKSARDLWKMLENSNSSEWWKNFMRIDKYGKVKKYIMKKFIEIIDKNKFLLTTELLGLSEAQLWIGERAEGPSDNEDERVFRERRGAEEKRGEPGWRISGIEAVDLKESEKYLGWFEVDTSSWSEGIYRFNIHGKAGVESPRGTPLRPIRDGQYSWPGFSDEELVDLPDEQKDFLYLEKNKTGFCLRIKKDDEGNIEPAGNGRDWISYWPQIKAEMEKYYQEKINQAKQK